MTENNGIGIVSLHIQKAPSPNPIPEPQDYLGLDAAGFLLVALGHLVKAIGKLDQEPPSSQRYEALLGARVASNQTRYALRVLDELKEETCEK
ncbi:hypothetical protein ES707_09608 [subsurface metagenome]